MKESITKFDLEAAFKALDKIDPPIVEKGIKANKPALTEIFSRKSKFDSLFEEYYDIGNSNELEDAKDAREAEIALAKLDRIEKIVDLDAKSPEDLLTSYVGKYIIQCPQCLTLFYKNPEDVEESEDDPTLVNVNEVCQHCGNESGYTLVGKVGEAEAGEFEESDVAVEEDENLEAAEEDNLELSDEDLELSLDDEELEELDIDIEDDEETLESEEDSKKENFSLNKHSDNILTEDTDFNVSAEDFEKLINSTEFKKSIADIEVRNMMQELEDENQKVSEALTEGVGADTANALKDVLTVVSKEDDKQGWANTIASIIDLVPNDLIDNLFDSTKDKLGNIKLNDTDKQELIEIAGQEINNDEIANADTFGKILALFDVTSWDSANLKKFLTTALGIVAVIEPTPILEVITGIITLLPTDIVKKILTITSISSVVGIPGIALNKGYQLLKKLMTEDIDTNEKTEETPELNEGIFDKVKDKFKGKLNKITDSLKSREDKANWILENTAEDYDKVNLNSKSGAPEIENSNKKFNTFIVVGFKETYSSGRPITMAPAFDNKDLVIAKKPVTLTSYQKADSLAKGWSLRQGNGPAFIYLAKDSNDTNAVFLCEYFEGELEHDQVEKYFEAVKKDLKSVELMTDSTRESKEKTSLNNFMKGVEELQEATLEQQISNSLIEAYQNVAGYRLIGCSYLNETFNIEGKVLFTSGNTRDITYRFISAKPSKNNKIELLGLNEKLGFNKQFTLTGYSNNRTFITESFKSTNK